MYVDRSFVRQVKILILMMHLFPVLELSQSFPDIFTIFREGHYAKWSPSKIGHFGWKTLEATWLPNFRFTQHV